MIFHIEWMFNSEHKWCSNVANWFPFLSVEFSFKVKRCFSDCWTTLSIPRLGKTFNRYDVAAAICMSTGLIFFTLADSKVQPNFNLYGVLIICSALVADAVIGNYQEKIMKEHHVPNVEIVFFSFIFGFIFVLTGLLVTNNFFSSLHFWNEVCSWPSFLHIQLIEHYS